jgi:tRNA-uridine 2-sulfurtransferase
MSSNIKISAPHDRVVIAMSGGVDSSVAAALLVEQGYEVIGITIKTYNYSDIGVNITNESSCCSLEGINDARQVASKLGFPHYVVDFTEQFKTEVIDNFISEYLNGRTPNPCVICNRKIKWETLLNKAKTLGAGYIATGHYARIRFDQYRHRFILSKGKDDAKDQSYALWSLTQEQLSRTIFPLAELTKAEVRLIAKQFELKTASKGESFEICFIPDNNYERFLKQRIPDLENKVKDGDLYLDGKIVGKHTGYPFYTVGQRKRLGTAFGEPIYVKEIDAQNNVVKLGRKMDLMNRGLVAADVNFISVGNIIEDMHVEAKVRYKDEGSPAVVRSQGEKIRVLFDEARRAITPGQSVVLYDKDDIVGGGFIESVFD